MNKMNIIPAVDILNGKSVRLTRGDYSKKIIYNTNPFEVAQNFINSGITHLHIIDLDGAKDGGLVNFEKVKEILQFVPLEIKVQYGGGIRDREDIYSILQVGVNQVILSSIIVDNLALLENFGKEFGFENITVAIDVKDGILQSHGWLKDTRIRVNNFLSDIISIGVQRFIYTDVSRDGTFEGPNFDSISKIRNLTNGVEMIVAGGIKSIEEVDKLYLMDIDGVVLGSSLYRNTINLDKIIAKYVN